MDLLDYQGASKFLGYKADGSPLISVAQLRRAVASKQLRCVRTGHRTVLFRQIDLTKWIEKNLQ